MNIADGVKFVVLDVETTGFSNNDRIIEIALITLDPTTLEVVEEYETLVNPERDIAATHIHGITASMVESAPIFADVAPVVARRLDGAVPVAHNWPFDKRMISNEFSRLGSYGRFGSGICTYRGTGLKLELACREYGVEDLHAHSALSDARATAKIFAQLVHDKAIDFEGVQPSSFVVLGELNPRTLRRSVADYPASFSRRIISYTESPWDGSPTGIYRYALNYVLDDGIIDQDEDRYLNELQAELKLTDDDALSLKKLHLATIIAGAERDGIVTQTQLEYIEKIAQALGLHGEPLPNVTGVAEQSDLREGMFICFTGTAYIEGERITRTELEYSATLARLVPVARVTKRTCDLVVAADPATQSNKARTARNYGIPVIGVEEFLSALAM